MQDRVRHVKCDETVPICSKCSHGGYKCEGLPPTINLPQHDTSALTQSPKSPLTLLSSGQDARFFDFFQDCGISMLSNGFGSDIWERVVIQTAHANAGVFRAIVALSMLLEDVSKWQMSWEVSFQAPVNKTTKAALAHYGTPLRQLADHSQSSESAKDGFADVVSAFFASRLDQMARRHKS
ncbi:hypothetical protein QQX98_010133 [Neonectria punicea]|uniref:Zn(2)-C6 fungal-type domain-containing protein n=1 Tax=Neonectria punicea TaxID=979145 RepID=A0ABR1GQP4_9HYPO